MMYTLAQTVNSGGLSETMFRIVAMRRLPPTSMGRYFASTLMEPLLLITPSCISLVRYQQSMPMACVTPTASHSYQMGKQWRQIQGRAIGRNWIPYKWAAISAGTITKAIVAVAARSIPHMPTDICQSMVQYPLSPPIQALQIG